MVVKFGEFQSVLILIKIKNQSILSSLKDTFIKFCDRILLNYIYVIMLWRKNDYFFLATKILKTVISKITRNI